MRSFDLWNTLAAGPDPLIPAGDQHESFPIAENVAQVWRGDVVVSDYYDKAKAERTLRNVCRLDNKLFVGNGIKYDGSVWKQINPESHMDDADYALQSAQKAGIQPIRTSLFELTLPEMELYKSHPLLARVSREARLTSFDPIHRALAVKSFDLNFPFLVLAALVLNQFVIENGYETVLLASRDAFMLVDVQKYIRDLTGQKYGIEYWLTSRPARYGHSESYCEYMRGLMKGKTLLVDVCGTGGSLRAIATHIECDAKLIVSYHTEKEAVPYFIKSRNFVIELFNPANHDRVIDVQDGKPVCELSHVDWEHNHEVETIHKAFAHYMDVLRKRGCELSASVDDLNRAHQRLENSNQVFGFEKGFLLDEVKKSGKRMRLLIAIPTCHRRNYGTHTSSGHIEGSSNGVQWVRDTWLKDAHGKVDVLFFYGRGATREPLADEVFLDCDDGYLGLMEKVQAMFRWARDNGYTQVLKCDDDTFLYIDRLIDFLSPIPYAGCCVESDRLRFTSGFCYTLGEQALDIVGKAPRPDDPSLGWREDWSIAAILKQHGILPLDFGMTKFRSCLCKHCGTDLSTAIAVHADKPKDRALFA